MRARVQWSVSKPWARAPWRSAWSMAASWASDRRGAGPVGPAAAQRVQPAGAPAGVPAADVLAGDAELVGDLGLGAAGGKQRPGLHADVFERLAVAQAAGVAAVGGWSHPAMLPGQPRSCHRNWRTSLDLEVEAHGLFRVRERRVVVATCGDGRLLSVSWEDAGLLVTVVVRCDPVVRGPDVAPIWSQRSRAWKARPGSPSTRDASPMPQRSVSLDQPLLSVGDRWMPVLRARGGHGRRGRHWLQPGRNGHQLDRRVRPARVTTSLVGSCRRRRGRSRQTAGVRDSRVSELTGRRVDARRKRDEHDGSDHGGDRAVQRCLQ